MENYQKVEQLVSKTGCSYEDGKAALEGCGWDMLDAVISLERDGKIKKETAEHKTEETVGVAPEVVVETIPEDGQSSYSYDGAAGGQSSAGSFGGQNTTGNYDGQNGAGYQNRIGYQGGAGNSGNGEGAPKKKFRLWARFKSIMTKNRMIVLKSNGQQMMDLPIWVPVIALLAFFWATLGIAVVAMVLGCRFHFEGEDLGKTNINSTMDKATDYAEKVKNDIAGKVNERQNTDN